ncbi:MAG: hypothetical protein CL916_01775 [Deltaproteobacteria bacterium]|nr:hypothetical protein [Deltaproteobacteria bacterium]
MTLVEIRRFKSKNWGRQGCSPQRFMQVQQSRASSMARIKTTVQRGRSFLLQTARWSGGRDFCRSFCRNHSNAQHISMHLPPGYETFEAWILFLSEWRRQCNLPQDERLHVIAERKGFRWKIKEIFSLIENVEERIFLFDQIERWPLMIIEDVQRAWKESQREQPTPLLILSGALQGGLFSNRIWLHDYSMEESRELILSALQRELTEDEDQWLELSGGMPELVYALRWGMKNQSFEQAWLSIRREIRSVIELMSTREKLFERLLTVKDGGVPSLQELDISLVQAGLARMVLRDGRQITTLRAPLIAEVLEPTIETLL